MDRLLAIVINELRHESDDGSVSRRHLELREALEEFCPFVEAVCYGVFVLPIRGPSRLLGGDDAVLREVEGLVARLTGHVPQLGVAEGLFSALHAAYASEVVAVGESDDFRLSLPIETLLDGRTAVTARRLGLHTVGHFARLSPARITERFSAQVLERHRVARGESDGWSLFYDPSFFVRLRAVRGEEEVSVGQQSFFGERSDADRRALAAGHRVAQRLGPDGVLTATLSGGRTPADRVRWLPLGAPNPRDAVRAPWPGALPSPAPATALFHPVKIDIRSSQGALVTVSGRGLLSDRPNSISFGHGEPVAIAWHAGPWAHDEGWWSQRRRRAHLHIVLEDERALWVYIERGKWWLAGVFD